MRKSLAYLSSACVLVGPLSLVGCENAGSTRVNSFHPEQSRPLVVAPHSTERSRPLVRTTGPLRDARPEPPPR
jgi:siroheme synthase (precorrin-2 oxidase/ferrochelatase)